MYINTISNFLEDIKYLEEDFKNCLTEIAKNGNGVLNLLDDLADTSLAEATIDQKGANKATECYLDYLASLDIVKAKKSIIWRLIKDTYNKKTYEEIVTDIKTIKKENKSEIASWIFSLPVLANILMDAYKEDENKKLLSAQIVLEGQFYYGDRIDVSIIGKDRYGHPAMVLIENKRWANLKEYTPRKKDNNKRPDLYVKDPLFDKNIPGHKREYIPHPCKQVEQYKNRLKNVNGYIQGRVKVDTAVYMLNPKINYKDEIKGIKKEGFLDKNFKDIIKNNPVFFGKDGLNSNGSNSKKEEKSLFKYITSKISEGCCVQTANKKIGLAEAIYGSKVKFSEKYYEILYKLSDNQHIREQKEIFDILLGENQKSIIDDILERIKGDTKTVFIIKGAAGTGKSLMGLALLAYLPGEGTEGNNEEDTKVEETRITPIYLVKCRETRLVIQECYNLKVLYSLLNNEDDSYDCIICDDAQRYQEKFFNDDKNDNDGKNDNDDNNNPLKTIINQAFVSVFFVDKDQIVHVSDYITESKIRAYVEDENKNGKNILVERFELDNQYRMKKSGLKEVKFLDLVDNVLGKLHNFHTNGKDIENTFGGYEFALADSPSVLFSRIRRKDKNRREYSYTSRVIAGKGHNWEWSPKGGAIGPFGNEKQTYYSTWKYNSETLFMTDIKSSRTCKEDNPVNYVGCIDFCQGGNLEYVGVIIAPDLVYKNGIVDVDLMGHQCDDYNIGKPTDNKKLLKRYKATQEGKVKLSAEDIIKIENIIKIIKNTYRVLLTRGEKGCYIYCCNPELQDHLAKNLFPALRIGEVKQKNDDYYILCDDNSEYSIPSQTITETEKEHDLKIAKESLNYNHNNHKVTFIVETNETSKRKYAVCLELDDPHPNDLISH